jgi:alanine racemase
MIGALRISLSALTSNAQALTELVGAGRAAFVVKGNAYGHGLLRTALAVEPYAAKICVYSIDEALELRDGGVQAPILVMGPLPPQCLRRALDGSIEFALWDMNAYVRDVAAAASASNARARVHVKLNTGLNRLGLAPGDLPQAVKLYGDLPQIEIAGVFSHLASAEEIDSPFTMQQLARFTDAYNRAAPALAAAGASPIRHIAASAAAMLWPQTRLDMARFGIALYGLWPSAQTREAMNGGRVELTPVLSYVSELVVVREIEAGEPVGYGTTFHAPRRMRLGIVPLGYADGVPRALSNAGAVAIDGIRAPIAGRIAMNMFYVDVSQVPSARTGSAVTLIGSSDAANVTADDWAAWCHTINYEIVTRLPSQLHRAYE